MIFRTTPLLAIVISALAAANLSLLTVVMANLTTDSLSPLTTDNAKPALPHIADTAQHTKSFADYDQILDQPIFFKSRAPFVPAPPPPPPVVQKAIPKPQVYVDPDFIVGGILINERLRKVYLFTKTNSVGTWVNEGDSFNGWTIQSVESGGVTMNQDSRAIDLQLYKRP